MVSLRDFGDGHSRSSMRSSYLTKQITQARLYWMALISRG